MIKITKETLKEAAEKLMFTMSEAEYQILLQEFESIIKQMEFISDIEGVDDAIPMTFPFEVTTDYLREDEPDEPLSREDALKNAKDVVDGQIRLPKVVG
jgi:aspartyl-tRNA(Asn)/glutamyl-tRNA(Gln) amidotransferase subunit C